MAMVCSDRGCSRGSRHRGMSGIDGGRHDVLIGRDFTIRKLAGISTAAGRRYVRLGAVVISCSALVFPKSSCSYRTFGEDVAGRAFG